MGCKRLAVSCVHLQLRLKRAFVSKSKYFDTAASGDTLALQIRGNAAPTGVKMCPVLTKSTLGVASQVVLRRQTGHLQPGLFACTSGLFRIDKLQEICHTLLKNKEVDELCCVCMCVCVSARARLPAHTHTRVCVCHCGCDECCLAL